MAESLKQQGLPAPQFDTSSAEIFKLTLCRRAAEMNVLSQLNDRQLKAIDYLKNNKKLTNAEYQHLCDTSRATATRDLAELLERGLVIKSGTTGKGTWYALSGS